VERSQGGGGRVIKEVGSSLTSMRVARENDRFAILAVALGVALA
jgi:hypothetical protein